jgi:hypothetical protein
MKMATRLALSSLLGAIVGGAIVFATLLVKDGLARYFAHPQVTLVNATGVVIQSATVSLGGASEEIVDLNDGRSIAVPIKGNFAECSTHVKWRDSGGTHEAGGQDYMENYGFYHSTIILMPGGQAKSIHEVPR